MDTVLAPNLEMFGMSFGGLGERDGCGGNAGEGGCDP